MEENIEVLIGKTLTAIENRGDEILFSTSEGELFKMYHQQDCCEGVRVDEIVGDWEDLIGSPIMSAVEKTNSEDTFGKIDYPESFTWTFYTLATVKGYVDIKWLGESNGYYSESVSFIKIK